MADIKGEVWELMKRNRRTSNGFEYTTPSPGSYPHQWLWDSCFHAIILTHFNPVYAKKEVLSFLSKQFDNGLIPHIIFWGGKNKLIDWGKPDTSSITQPPMLSYTVWRILQADGDLSFVKKIYPNLFHFYKYLLNERDPHDNHLIGILNPDESGEDNSPRFDKLLNLPSVHSFRKNLHQRFKLVEKNVACKFDAPFCMRNFFWVKDVPFNCIMVANLKILANLAQKLNFADDALYFAKQADEITKAMRKIMLDEDLFWSVWGSKYDKIKVKTWAIFAPLFAEILTKSEAKQLLEKNLLNKGEFWTPYQIPTTALDEPGFVARSSWDGPNWRGPVWIGVNWFIYQGLKYYGFLDVAKKIKDSSEDLIKKSGFREYYNPLTGEGLGAKDFTWGGLVLDMN